MGESTYDILIPELATHSKESECLSSDVVEVGRGDTAGLPDHLYRAFVRLTR